MELRARTATEMLPKLARAVMVEGDEVGSRGGSRTMEVLHPHVILEQPWRREVLTPGRRCSIAAQVAETMWVLSGRNDVAWLSHYLPRATDFSDDGNVWRGGYGPRLRNFDGTGLDQVDYVVGLLREDPLTRRAVAAIYDPTIDMADGKDIPCNDFITFQSRLGKLHMGVTIRSNDLIWGWSGINAFEWSALQEIVAALVGVQVGSLHFNIASLHVYDRHWERATRLSTADFDPMLDFQDSPRFHWHGGLAGFDALCEEWFRLEEEIRSGEGDGATHGMINDFPEPMLQSWLRIIEWYWTKDTMFLGPLKNTNLHRAAQVSA